MIKKQNNFNVNITIFLAIITVLLIYFYYLPFHQNVFQYIDQELTLSYNGYLLTQGFDQEYTDHPGLFNILLTYLVNFIRIKLEYIPNNFDDLNRDIISGVESLIVSSRISNVVLFTIFSFFIFVMLNKSSKNIILNTLLTIFILTNSSLLFHTLEYRTEFLTVFLMLISFYFFHRSLKSNQTPKITFYLIFAVLFYFFSLLNKTQIFFYYPIYLLIFFLLFSFKNDFPKTGNKLLITSFFFLFLNIFFYYKISNQINFYINLFNYIFFNIIIYIYFVHQKSKLEPNIIFFIFNIIFVFTHFFLLQLTKNIDFLSSSLMANINNPTRMLVFTGSKDILDQSLSKIIIELISKIISSFINFFLFYFKLTNFVNFIIIIILFWSSFIKRNIKILFISIIGLVFTFVIGTISMFRYIAPEYLIFIDIINIILLVYVFIVFEIRFRYIFLTLLIIANIYKFTFLDTKNIKDYSKLICGSFINDFQKKLYNDKLINECSNF